MSDLTPDNNEPPVDPEALAKQRFMLLNLVRLMGLAAVLIGIAITQGAIDLPFAVGVVLAVFGLLEFFLMPNILAKNWKSDEE
ncbi:MAG: hypothetical protein ABJ239_02115 [Erythrobacter sp.]